MKFRINYIKIPLIVVVLNGCFSGGDSSDTTTITTNDEKYSIENIPMPPVNEISPVAQGMPQDIPSPSND